jgi:sec-independent protein translocase protein TatC
MDHIKELRNRGTIVALILLVGACLAYSFNKQLLEILKSPLGGTQELISLNVGGSFAVIMNISIATGFVLATPFLIYHLYAFLRPMMPKKMRQNAALMFFSSLTLLAGGVAFAYYLALPGALDFLLKFSDGAIVMNQLSVDAYLGFFIKYLLGLALIFQTPLVLMMIHWVKPLTPGGLMKSERWVIVISFIAAALITPTSDPINLMMVALPTVAVYQLGVIVIIYGVLRDRRRAKKQVIRTQRQELAAARRAVVERKKLNVAPVRAVPLASQQLQAPLPASVKPIMQDILYEPIHQQTQQVVQKPVAQQAMKPTIDGFFLPQPRVKAPELAMVHRVEAQAVPRPAERSAQTYRTRKSIDGFGRRPSTALAHPPIVSVPAITQPMQQMATAGNYPGRSVDGITAALAS